MSKTISSQAILVVLFVQILVISVPSFGASLCNKPSGFQFESQPPISRWASLRNHVGSAIRSFVERSRPSQEVIPPKSNNKTPSVAALKGLPHGLAKGWDLKLMQQNLPVEILQFGPPSDFELPLYLGVRLWVESDLGVANINIYQSGKVEISLNSIMNRFAASKAMTLPEILQHVAATSAPAAEVQALVTSGHLFVSENTIHLATDGSDSTTQQSATRVLQSIINFLEKPHPEANLVNLEIPENNASWSVNQKISQALQRELGMSTPEIVTTDVFYPSNLNRKVTDPEMNRPPGYAKLNGKIQGVGEVTFYVGTGDLGPNGLRQLIIKPNESRDQILNQEAIYKLLGPITSAEIEKIHLWKSPTTFQIVFKPQTNFEKSWKTAVAVIESMK